MLIYFTIFFFLIGLVVASFINALLYRIDKEYKYPDIFVKGSHCEKCKKQLNWYELIPVLSYIIFLGKCKKCGYSIPLYYPLSELFLGLGFAAIYANQLSSYYYMLILFLFVMAYFDRIYHGLPKEIVHAFLLFSVVVPAIFFIQGNIPSTAILISIALSLFIFAIGKILKKPFGIGDIFVLLGLGLLLSPTQYLIFIYILLTLAFIYVILFLLMKKITLKSKIPLLPFMFSSLVLTLIFEESLYQMFNTYYYFVSR